MFTSLWLCVMIDELYSLVVIYVNEFMIIVYVYELWLMSLWLWFMICVYKFMIMSYELSVVIFVIELMITVYVYELWLCLWLCVMVYKLWVGIDVYG